MLISSSRSFIFLCSSYISKSYSVSRLEVLLLLLYYDDVLLALELFCYVSVAPFS